MAVVVSSVNGRGTDSGYGSDRFHGSASVANLYALGLLAHFVLCGLGIFFSLFKLLGFFFLTFFV